MAEPRKPRVIRTRLSEGPATPKVRATEQHGGENSAVRKTSSKVSVEPLAAKDDAPEEVRKSSLTAVDVSGLKERFTPKPRAKAPAAPAKPRADKAKRSAPVKKKPAAPRGASGEGAKVLNFPLPEFKRRRLTFWYSLAAAIVVVALVMGIALFSPVLNVRTVVFDGQKLVSDATLQLAVAPIVDKPLPQVTESEVQGLLGAIVQVKSSRIEARPPSTLLVHIVERIPVALLKNGKEFLLVDQDGAQLGVTKDPTKVALPVIDGGTAAIGQDTFRAMTAVLSTLPQSILSKLANATAKSPDAVELALSDGRSVVWGNASDMELKAQVLEALLNAPAPTAAAGKPAPEPAKVFDVSAPRHPVTR